MDQLARTRALMNAAVRDVMVSGYEALEASLEDLPDADDRHVVAAAIHCGAQVIVTFNLDDFPPSVLRRFNIEAQHPDPFVLGLLDLDASVVEHVVRKQAADLNHPPRTIAELLDTLRANALERATARLAAQFGLELA